MKKNGAFSIIILLTLLLSGCGSTKLTQQYKNPDMGNYQANKVLIVGITADKYLRRTYEKEIVKSLEKEDVIAVKSIDFFEQSFTKKKRSLQQLNEIDKRLLAAGFDAILLTKVIDKVSRITLAESYRNFAANYQTFEKYYYGNQLIYFKEDMEHYQIYITETSLYCICPGNDRELIWRGEIEVVDADKVNRNINSYINVFFKTLKENSMLLID